MGLDRLQYDPKNASASEKREEEALSVIRSLILQQLSEAISSLDGQPQSSLQRCQFNKNGANLLTSPIWNHPATFSEMCFEDKFGENKYDLSANTPNPPATSIPNGSQMIQTTDVEKSQTQLPTDPKDPRQIPGCGYRAERLSMDFEMHKTPSSGTKRSPIQHPWIDLPEFVRDFIRLNINMENDKDKFIAFRVNQETGEIVQVGKGIFPVGTPDAVSKIANATIFPNPLQFDSSNFKAVSKSDVRGKALIQTSLSVYGNDSNVQKRQLPSTPDLFSFSGSPREDLRDSFNTLGSFPEEYRTTSEAISNVHGAFRNSMPRRFRRMEGGCGNVCVDDYCQRSRVARPSDIHILTVTQFLETEDRFYIATLRSEGTWDSVVFEPPRFA